MMSCTKIFGESDQVLMPASLISTSIIFGQNWVLIPVLTGNSKAYTGVVTDYSEFENKPDKPASIFIQCIYKLKTLYLIRKRRNN